MPRAPVRRRASCEARSLVFVLRSLRKLAEKAANHDSFPKISYAEQSSVMKGFLKFEAERDETQFR